MKDLRKQITYILLYGAGLSSIAAVVYLAGPMVEIGGYRPLENYIIRDVLVTLLVAAAAGMSGFTFWKGRKAKAALAEVVSGDKEPQNDEPVLKDRMKDALATLKQSAKGKGDFLYDVPWYVIIGPPGAGKTTALVNSGLKFPLSRGATPAAVAGVGGTRYCDWWFTEDAVLIDTAGRYTTQDSDAKSDKVSWFAFLDLLKKSRPRQPINGVIIAISVADILTASATELEAHADAIRARLLDLHTKLKVDFPVYAVFTKTDLIAGFNEFFGILGEKGRKQVWGATFQTTDKTQNLVGDVPAEFDALIARLNDLTTDRLQEEAAPTTRVALYGFPAQMAALRKPVFNFLNKIFEPTRYHANATLRGFYFTSGTQMGTPIDQLIGALSKTFGAEEVYNAGFSGKGRSYFLTDLIGKLIIGEAAWVSTDWRALRRQRIIKTVLYTVLLLGTAGMCSAWYVSYVNNKDLLDRTSSAAAEFVTAAGPLAKESVVADRDLTKVLPFLHRLRYLPVGYAQRSVTIPFLEGLGLSRRERILSVSENSYAIGLERLFRPRLMYRLEEQFEQRPNDTSFIYEALKVYLMLGGQKAADKDLVVAWMRRDWEENLYPGSGNVEGRKALEEHLVSMLELQTGEPLVGVNGALVEAAQNSIVRLSLSQRAYEILKSQARAGKTPAFQPAKAAGADFSLVFDIKGSDTLEGLSAPGFLTWQGFHRDFLDKLGSISEQLKKEQWVLGQAGKQATVADQYDRLPADLMALYSKEFITTWEQMLGKLRMKRLTGDKPKYLGMAALVAATSPLTKLLVAVRDETAMTRDRPDLAKPVEKDKDGKPLPPKEGAEAPLLLPKGLTGAPGAEIEAAFKSYHVLVDGDATRRPVDDLIASLAEIHRTLLKATTPSLAAEANLALGTQVAGLRSNAPRYPGPFANMLQGAANEFDGDLTTAQLAQINRVLSETVIAQCQQKIANRYPFVKSDRDVALADFGQFFGPQGIMDTFVRTQLAQYIDISKPEWVWRPDTPLGRTIAQSTAPLKEFHRAAQIRETFFASGGQFPSMSLTVTPPALPVPPPPPIAPPVPPPPAPGTPSSGGAFNIFGGPTPPPAPPAVKAPQTATAGVQYRFEVSGTPVASQQGPPQPSVVQWPGANGRSAVIVQGDVPGAQPAILDRPGPWALFRLIEAGSPVQRGDRTIVNYFVAGRELQYSFAAGGSRNPFTMPALREFRCPGTL